jgi:hypothetical protein
MMAPGNGKLFSEESFMSPGDALKMMEIDKINRIIQDLHDRSGKS